jgi:hypothetical protein
MYPCTLSVSTYTHTHTTTTPTCYECEGQEDGANHCQRDVGLLIANGHRRHHKTSKATNMVGQGVKVGSNTYSLWKKKSSSSGNQ